MGNPLKKIVKQRGLDELHGTVNRGINKKFKYEHALKKKAHEERKKWLNSL
jgi:hypothetical protein